MCVYILSFIHMNTCILDFKLHEYIYIYAHKYGLHGTYFVFCMCTISGLTAWYWKTNWWTIP